MTQNSKGSARRGKPSYVMSIIGVTLVLFLLGIVGWLTINSRKLIEYFKESVHVQVFLLPNVPDSSRISLQNYIASQPYTKTWKFTDKEAAKKEWLATGGEEFTPFLENNLLPESIDFTLKADYLDSTELSNINADLSKFRFVSDVKYPHEVVNKMQHNFNVLKFGVGIIALLVALMVIILIDNTIRLAMFSNRFLIKTMQMVGATRWFIAKPLSIRAIINGSISGIIAMALVYGLILIAEKFLPDLAALQDTKLLVLLFFGLIIIGITITLFSTYRSVLKYLRMKLDDLY